MDPKFYWHAFAIYRHQADVLVDRAEQYQRIGNLDKASAFYKAAMTRAIEATDALRLYRQATQENSLVEDHQPARA